MTHKHKPPKPVWTIILSFGPSMPPFQQHFPRERDAKIAALHLKDRMNGARGRCIEGVQLWNAETMIASYYPVSIVLPPPDADGIRRIPENGRGMKRLPSQQPSKAAKDTPEIAPRPADYDPSKLYI